MRRAKALGLSFVLLIAAMLGCDLTQNLATSLPNVQTQTAQALNYLNDYNTPGHPTGLPPTPALTAWAATLTKQAYLANATDLVPTTPPTLTPSPSPTPTLTPHEADLTPWAEAATITPTPILNTLEVNQTRSAAWTATAASEFIPTVHDTHTAVSPENAQATAEAYGTAYADAPGTLEVPVDSDGLRPRVTLNEAHVNAIIAPYAAEVANVSNVYLDLVPGGGMLTATLTVLGLQIQVSATSLLVVEDGVLLTHVTSASIGGIAPPSAALEAVNNDLVPMVNSAINDVLAEYGSLSVLYITDLEVTHTDLIVEFIFLTTPRPTATPTASP